MRYAILSDIHGNLEALEAVIQNCQKETIERYLCLGDIVGYGASPRECLGYIREISDGIIAGNHDFAVVGRIDVESFNVYAREAALWTRDQLRPSDLAFLNDLPLVEHFDEGFTIVHSALYSPEIFDYIHCTYEASLSLGALPGEVCFVGHSHVPVNFIRKESIVYSFEQALDVEAGTKVLVNVGSVGQPRDNNPDSCYAIYDTDARRISLHRVSYDVETSAAKIKKAGLPDLLGDRLKIGR